MRKNKHRSNGAFEIFVQAINEESPDTYAQTIRQGVEQGQMSLEGAMVIPFDYRTPDLNNWLRHKNPRASGAGRDSRVVRWLEACEELGGKVEPALERAARHIDIYNKGLRLLLSSQYERTLDWYRDRGAEKWMRFSGSNPMPSNLASMAIFHGLEKKARELSSGDTDLLETDVLWTRCLHKNNLSKCHGLAELLLSKNKCPPPGMMNLVAACQINEANKTAVLDFINAVLPYENPRQVRQQANQNLMNIIEEFRSSASLVLLEAFLDLGANPLGEANAKNPNTTTPLGRVLEKWATTSTRNHLRTPLWQAFEMMAQRLKPEVLLDFLTNGQVDKTIRHLNKGRTTPGLWHDEVDDEQRDRDIAMLKRYTLELRANSSILEEDASTKRCLRM